MSSAKILIPLFVAMFVPHGLTAEDSDQRFQIEPSNLIMSVAVVLLLIVGILGFAIRLGQLRHQIRNLRRERDKEDLRLAEEKSRFLAGMNHDIRTPLNALLGFCELLEGEISSDRGRRFLEAIRTSGNSLGELFNDILDLSKIEAGMLALSEEPVNVREFVEGLQRHFTERARVSRLHFEVSVDAECPRMIVIDPLRVRQILVNLLGNAMQYASQGSVLFLARALAIHDGKCDFAFSVRHTGGGIARENFEGVSRPHPPTDLSDKTLSGARLGFGVCRELAHLMRGEFQVSGGEGEATEYLFVLKQVVIGRDPGEVPDGVSGKADFNFNDLPPCRILVVDDNLLNIELISGYFEGSHHRLDFASNGLDALQMMHRYPPDLVLMDIRMPVMSGDEAFLLMKDDEALASIPVVAVTASPLSSQEHRLRELFDGYLQKPFARAGLFRVMESLLLLPDRHMKIRGKERQSELFLEVPPHRLEIGPQTALPGASGRIRNAQLIDELTTLRDGRWCLLLRAMLLSDVASVADDLTEMAMRYEVPELSDYANDLRLAVEQINQPQIENLLRQFGDLIKKLS